MVKDENVTIPFCNARSHNSIDYIPFLKDMNMDEVEASPTAQAGDSNFQDMLKEKETSSINEYDDCRNDNIDSILVT